MSVELGKVIEDTPCPGCGEFGLFIELRDRFFARPLGSFSLAGMQVKASAVKTQWPYLVCGECGISAPAKSSE